MAPVTASTLNSRSARSRRCKITALARREYKNIISMSNTLSNMQLPIRTKQRAAYQPMVNRTELERAATKKFGIQAAKVTINHKSRIVRLRANSTASAVVSHSQSARLI
jgi:hypothetical protein